MTRVNLNDGTQPTPLSTEERHLDVIQELVEERDRLRAKLRASEAEVARLTRELEDVRKLDELAIRHGTRLGIPAKIPGFDPGDGSDHLHFVMMPIGARSRRAAVEYLKKESKDE